MLTQEQLDVTVAPYDRETGAGQAVPVDFGYDRYTDLGAIDLSEARAALGDAGTGRVILTLHVDGTPVSAILYGEAAGSDGQPTHDIEYEWGPYPAPLFEHYPERYVTWQPLLPELGEHGGASIGAPGLMFGFQEASVTAVYGPYAGTLQESAAGEGSDSFLYTRDDAASPSDLVTLTWARDGVEQDQSIIITADGLRDGLSGSTEVLLRMLADGEELPAPPLPPAMEDYPWPGETGGPVPPEDYPQTPRPEEPAEPAEPTSPTAPTDPADPAAPGDDVDAPEDGDHTVPGTVETGDGAAWWLAALGALGAGALVTARRAVAAR